MSVFSATTALYVGSTSYSKAYVGDTQVWPIESEITVLRYRTYNDNIAALDTGSAWYSAVTSNTYSGGLGTVIFNSVQTTFYKLFEEPSKVTYIEIPESITHIDNYAFRYYTPLYYGGAQVVALPHTAPSVGSFAFYDAHFVSFEYPDDANYVSWYVPGYVTGQTYSVGYNSIINALGIIGTNLCPQFVYHGDTTAYSPSRIVGWDGNYLGDLEVEYNDDYYHYYMFDRKIFSVPDDAFNGWNSNYNSTVLSFPDCTKTIGDRAFRNAKLYMMPRFRGVTELGEYALNTNSFTIVDLPSGLTKVGSYCFGTGATRINAYGSQPTSGSFDIRTSGGTFAYNSNYNYNIWRNRVPSTWTKQGIDPSSWPNLDAGEIYVHATANTLTLKFGLYDSTEGWEDGGFYISGGSYTAKTEIAYLTHDEQEKTVTVSVQSGQDYVIGWETRFVASGGYVYTVSGGQTLYVNEEYYVVFHADASNVLITKNHRGSRGGCINNIFCNNDYRFGY